MEKGIACTLRCQLVVDGCLTAWCQQHDEVTFEPRGARSFEKPSLTAFETVDNPSVLHVNR